MIDRDFSEAQVEMVTHVRTSPEKLYESILQKRENVVSVLNSLKSGRELLWPHSVPPYLTDEKNIRVAQYTGERNWKSRFSRSWVTCGAWGSIACSVPTPLSVETTRSSWMG